MKKWIVVALSTLMPFVTIAALAATTASNPHLEVDIAYDRMAQQLELIRNQMELTIDNHNSLESDIGRQQKEIMAFDLFLRIPLAKADLKNDKDLLEAVRNDLEKAATNNGGFKVRNVKFATKWSSAPKRVPDSVPFDEGYRAPENQIVDSRDVTAELEFDSGVPANRKKWFSHQQESMRRLMVAKNPASWKKKGKRLTARLSIYRFRDFKYPEFVAPDLSRYVAPGQPVTQTQTAASKRIERYRREIIELWPRVQSHLKNVREFAMNDLRMSFFLKHANVHE